MVVLLSLGLLQFNDVRVHEVLGSSGTNLHLDFRSLENSGTITLSGDYLNTLVHKTQRTSTPPFHSSDTIYSTFPKLAISLPILLQAFLSFNSFLLFISIILFSLCIYFYVMKKNTQDRNKKLEALNKEKNQIIGAVSHDLRSPLNSITGLSELILDDANTVSPNTIKEYHSIILGASHRMEHLINNMLDVNKIETGNAIISIKPILVQEIIEEVANALLFLQREKEIEMEVKIGKNLPEALADYYSLQRILENLISNAFKFSEKGTKVLLEASETPHQVQISVTDQGPGLTDLDKSKLFGKFEKLSASPTANEKSTGLGLFIVKNLVKEMNGTILVESNYGKGTTFNILFNKA